MPGPPHEWRNVHASRWNWADRAFDEFATQLPEPMRQGLRGPSVRAYNAVLFGKTQTGKTTLILRMLGIDATSMAEVAEVLRAGRPASNSSTAVATRYRWSTFENLWELREGGKHGTVDSNQAVDWLSGYRNAHGRLTKPGADLEIGIPLRYRRSAAPDVVPSILDLPGVDAADPMERAHARRLLREHVPRAHTVILVVRANQLTPLFQDAAAEQQELRVWTLVPERFRVVVTHTYSQDSIKSALVAAGGAVTQDWIREQVVAQMRRSAPKRAFRDDAMANRVKAITFPVEFGDSWDALKETDSKVFEAASPLVDQFMTELTERITSLACEDADRIAFAHATKVVDLASQAEAERVGREERAALQGVSKAEGAVKARQHDRDMARQRLCSVDAESDRLELVASVWFDLDLLGPRPPSSSRKAQVHQSGATMQSDLHHNWQEIWRSWRDSEQVRKLERVTECPVGEPGDAGPLFRQRWGCGTCDCRVRWTQNERKFTSKSAMCSLRQLKAWDATNKDMAGQLRVQRSTWVRDAREVLRARRETCEAYLAEAERDVKVANRRLDAAVDRLMAVQKRRELQENESELARRNALELFTRLDAELRQEVTGRLRGLSTNEQPVDRACSALGVLLVLRQRDVLDLGGSHG